MAVKSDVFILTLRQQVLLPGIRTSITVPAKIFTELCDFAEKNDSTHVGVVTVKATTKGVEELYSVGTYARIVSHTQTTTKVNGKDNSMVALVVDGQNRCRVKSFTQTSPFRVATLQLLQETQNANDAEVKALVSNLQSILTEMLSETGSQEGQQGGAAGLLSNLFGQNKKTRWPSSPSLFADMAAWGLQELSIAERQQVLETVEVRPRLELVIELAKKVVEVHRLSKEISSKVQRRSEDELRETVLRRQLRDLQRKLRKAQSVRAGRSVGEEDDDEEVVEAEEAEEEDDAAALREALERAQLSPEAQKVAKRELRRLQNIQPQHPEYSVCRNYLETLASLPWAESTSSKLDLLEAQRVLERDHYGLQKVKRRILEFLAVQKMRGDMKGPILCLHGPPGVGKTSLGRSVAKALGRKFHRIALGGVRDEAELRGHRRTYIGSMPGNLIQALISLKVNNPVILLDEIDKLSRSRNFNPSGAMLEILDPEQNNTFKDHYINVPFDLSHVLFLCTCNDLHTIDRPLLDRMEIIDLSGYTVEEKLHIGTTHLLPKQRRLHALEEADPANEEHADHNSSASGSSSHVTGGAAALQPGAPLAPRPVLLTGPRLLVSDAAVADVVTKYTRESGVRSLDRCLAQICRWAALRLADPDERSALATNSAERLASDRKAEEALAECGPDAQGIIRVDAKHLPYILGPEHFEADPAERLAVGVAMGLSVSSLGGDLLFVEASRTQGSGVLTVTGQLGEVMRESVTTALSLLRSKIYHEILVSKGLAWQAARLVPEAAPTAQVPPTAAAERASSAAVGRPPQTGEPHSPELHLLKGEAHFRRVFKDLIVGADPDKDPFEGDDIHVHFPAGAIPKDGPSAGIATTLALASLLLKRPMRSDTAVTGEVTLRGHILPVGGIRDKVLAAHRAGLRYVLLPFANQRHVKDELPAPLLAEIQVQYVKHIGEALSWAFEEGKPEAWPQQHPVTLVPGRRAGTSYPAVAVAPFAKL